MSQQLGFLDMAGAIALVKKIPEAKDMKIKARKLNETLTRTLFPALALHVALTFSLILRHDDPALFHALRPVLVASAIFAIAEFLVRVYREQKDASPEKSVGLSVFPAIAILAYLEPEFAWAGGLVLFAAVAIASLFSLAGRVPPLAMVLISIYAVAAYSVFAHPGSFSEMVVFTLPALAVPTIILWRLRSYGHLIGILVAAILAFFLSVGPRESNVTLLVLFAVIILAVLLIYEIATAKAEHSDLVRFATLGAVVCAIVGIEFSAFDFAPAPTFGIAAAIFCVYSAIAWLRGARTGYCAHASWVIILTTTSLASTIHEQGVFLAAAVLLFGVSLLLKNEFARMLSGLAATAGMWMAVNDLAARSRALVTALDPRQQYSSTIERLFSDFPAFYAWVIAPAIAGVIISQFKRPEPGLAWWRGLVSPRRAVVVRQLLRFISKKLKDAPIVGGLYGLVETAVTYMKYAKSDGTNINKYDVLQLGAFAVIAVATAYFLRPYFILNLREASIQEHAAFLLSTIAGWVVCGIALAIWGNLKSSLLHSFAAFAFFCVPAATELSGAKTGNPLSPNEAQWIIVVLLWAFPVFLIGLLPKPNV